MQNRLKKQGKNSCFLLCPALSLKQNQRCTKMNRFSEPKIRRGAKTKNRTGHMDLFCPPLMMMMMMMMNGKTKMVAG
jgi:hypothetical protein